MESKDNTVSWKSYVEKDDFTTFAVTEKSSPKIFDVDFGESSYINKKDFEISIVIRQ